jgi:hypothetical protein
MHQRAGVKLHHGWMPNAPTGGLLLRDKQDEKRIASPANVPETSSVASPSVLPLPQLILRPRPSSLSRARLARFGPGGTAGRVSAYSNAHCCDMTHRWRKSTAFAVDILRQAHGRDRWFLGKTLVASAAVRARLAVRLPEFKYASE